MSFLRASSLLCASKTQDIRIAKLWAYVAIAFNKVDDERLKLIGPDRLCAEWILKNGGAVSFTAAPGRYLRDYNNLPAENVKVLIKEIDASDSSIMKIGLDHFKNCKYIDKIIFHNCKHLEMDGLAGLVHVKETLRHLQVSGCHNIEDGGLNPIKELYNLKYFKIFDMPYVRNLENALKELKAALPKCEIVTAE